MKTASCRLAGRTALCGVLLAYAVMAPPPFVWAQPNVRRTVPPRGVPPRVVPGGTREAGPGSINPSPPPQATQVKPPPVKTPGDWRINPAASNPAAINQPRQYVMSLAADKAGRVWVGTEDEGVWRYTPAAAPNEQWQQFTTRDGLGDDNAYALAVDQQGRIWAGHLNHGVSVFNGQTWRNYGVLDGPLGERVFDIATCPTDGDVWIATSAGLSRYSLTKDTWHYYTRADGLPSDQIQAIAFDKAGNIIVGTQCDGVALAQAATGYKTWSNVDGPSTMPTTPTGEGLPGSLINDVLVSHDGTIYVATTLGLVWSRDQGKKWSYVRGRDYAAKVMGRLGGPPQGWREQPGALLAEDYITRLAEDQAGRLWLGHWQQGNEVIELQSGKNVPAGLNRVTVGEQREYVTALLPLSDTAVLIAAYGRGLRQSSTPAKKDPPTRTQSNLTTDVGMPGSASSVLPPASMLPLPSAAKLPTEGELIALLNQVKARDKPLPEGSGVYGGEDWRTQGDWVGRYGRQYARLCAASSPLDSRFGFDTSYSDEGRIGPHCTPGDSLRHWLHWSGTDQPRCLYHPVAGYRRQAEWDDHGEVYARSHEGPDLWTAVQVPEGVQRISLYFVNKDGHSGANRYRDYVVELKPYLDSLPLAEAQPSLAKTRVRDFWHGVYKRFIVQGPGKFWIKIARNNSHNTILSAILIDKLQGPETPYDRLPLPWMDQVRYEAPRVLAVDQTSPTNASTKASTLESGTPEPATSGLRGLAPRSTAAVQLWGELDSAYSRSDAAAFQWPYRLLSYRALAGETATTASAADEATISYHMSLLANWRWKLELWDEAQRRQFKAVMARALVAWKSNNPQSEGTAEARQQLIEAVKKAPAAGSSTGR